MRKQSNPLILEILDIDKVKNLSEKINKRVDIKENIYELSKYVKDYPKCKICGNPIYFEKMTICIKGKNIHIVSPPFEQKFENHTFHISKCIDCIKDNFKDDMPSMQRYLFQIRYRWAKFVYDIPEDIHKEIRSDMCGVTPKTLIRKHGEEEGMKIWNEYCRKQSETNTFEYKQKKYGWTKEQFDEYNKSRACTIENFIERHGEELGKQKWEEYVNRQKETKSWDYMVEKFGEEKALEINASKALCKETFINKYGETEGLKRFKLWSDMTHWGYSSVSQNLFNDISNILNIRDAWYAISNKGEYKIIDKLNKKTYLLDYYIPELKICVEFDGDMWHANPTKYKPTDYPNPYSNLSAQEIWEADKRKQEYLESQGIKVVRIWESEYKSKDFNIHKFIRERMGLKIG